MNETNESGYSPFFINRRDFVKKSAMLGAAGLTLGAVSPLKAAAAAGNEINIAVIGNGAERAVLLNSLKNIPGIRFVALCDIWNTI